MAPSHRAGLGGNVEEGTHRLCAWVRKVQKQWTVCSLGGRPGALQSQRESTSELGIWKMCLLWGVSCFPGSDKKEMMKKMKTFAINVTVWPTSTQNQDSNMKKKNGIPSVKFGGKKKHNFFWCIHCYTTYRSYCPQSKNQLWFSSPQSDLSQFVFQNLAFSQLNLRGLVIFFLIYKSRAEQGF